MQQYWLTEIARGLTLFPTQEIIMADQAPPTFDFDVSKFFNIGKLMDPSKMGDFAKMADFSKGMDFTKMFAAFGIPGVDMTKMFSNFNAPGVDMQSLLSSQRKNIEALTQANKVALEGMQAVFRRQAEILKQSIEETTAATRDLSSPAGSPQDKVAKQTEIAKSAFEKSLANARELSEIVTKANGEAVDLLNKRFSAMLDEFKDAVAKGK
jgi:phasin family protein